MVTHKSGYSLIELMMVVGLVGLTITVGATLLRQGSLFFAGEDARMTLQSEGRVIVKTILKNLRQAKASTVVVDQNTGQPPYSKISFVTISGSTFTYAQNGSVLIQTDGGVN
jgi:prepilin-type N-terminal cleavage/methylation domain-containing protein